MAKDAIQDLRRRANVPNPLGSAAPLIALAAIALVLDAAPDLPWEVGVGVAALFGAAAAEAARLSRELDAATLPGAVPLNRAAVRPYRQELEAISAALESGEPVSARGVLLVQELLS